MFQKFVKNKMFLLIGLLCFVLPKQISLVEFNLPCNFIDSINITDGILQSNKSILFNGILFPKDQYAKVNYNKRNGNSAITIVEPYIRGCPCNIKECIRLCCPFGSFVDSMTFNGEFTCNKNEAAKNIKSEILLDNNQTIILDLPQHFSFIDRACKRHFYADDFQITQVNTLKT